MADKQTAVDQLAKKWYAALDTHEPLAVLVAMLDPRDLKMVFPEATLSGVEGFTGWYEGVIRIFFDEVHAVQSAKITADHGDKAEVAVVVKWEASRWKAPAPKSERIMLLAYQTWAVSFDAQGSARIATYTVDQLEYLPGSVQL